MNLELYRPAVHDLWFKRDLLADEATMSYNRAWGGTVDFPEGLWGRWHEAWVVREGEGRRYYRYLRDSDTGEFVGEVAYRWDPEYDSFITDVLVHAHFRGRGYGAAGLELLCDAARGRGVATLRDNVALDNPAIGLFRRHGFVEEWRSDEFVMLRRDLKVGDHTTPVPRAQFRTGEVGVVWSTRLK